MSGREMVRLYGFWRKNGGYLGPRDAEEAG